VREYFVATNDACIAVQAVFHLNIKTPSPKHPKDELSNSVRPHKGEHCIADFSSLVAPIASHHWERAGPLQHEGM
jgi:hypothetical protein